MKTSFIIAGLVLSTVAQAQTVSLPSPSVPPKGVPLRAVLSQSPAQSRPAEFEITLDWNQKTTAKLSVPLRNPGDQPFVVSGVQTTSGIFVTGHPEQVPAKGEGSIEFIYDAPALSESTTEVIRVKTDQGVKVLHLLIKREPAVTFSDKKVAWKIGEKLDAKAITLQIPKGSVVPLRLKVSGVGNHAELEKIDSKSYRVKITPGSTAKTTQFAITVEFDQPLPGVAPVIVGSVGD